MGKKLKILILEDIAPDFELMMNELSRSGIVFSSKTVKTRLDFITELKNFAPNLIFAALPGFDGFSALKIVKEKYPDVPFIFVSGKIGEEMAVEALKKGATDYVLKDQMSKLVPSVCRALQEVKERNERKRAEKKLKASLKEKRVMLREIHHRVKNNMQIIMSLLRLQSYSIKDKDALEKFKESQHRIKSMALIHESLYKSGDLSNINFFDYLNKMLKHLLSTYKEERGEIKFTLEAKGIYLDINKAIPCGLLVNELVSNSLKHAFPEGIKGEIIVKMKQDKRKKRTLIVKDTGIRLQEELNFREPKTLGMQLVKGLVDQLDGKIEVRRDGGTEFKIVF